LPAGRVLDISKIQLTQPRLVELGLKLSLAKMQKCLKYTIKYFIKWMTFDTYFQIVYLKASSGKKNYGT
jgi:hypothetical protein